jgi:hypothetical protein
LICVYLSQKFFLLTRRRRGGRPPPHHWSLSFSETPMMVLPNRKLLDFLQISLNAFISFLRCLIPEIHMKILGFFVFDKIVLVEK